MKNALYIGRVSGIKIFIHWTFLILIAWIVLTNLRAGAGSILWSLAFILAIFGCVVLHELGHALTAQRYKIRTLDITLYPIGGVARLESLPDKPKEELVVAIAGPMVNLVIAGLLYPLADFSVVEQIQQATTVGPGNFLVLFITVNIWLALFNLLPAFPMDGGRIFRALLSFRMSRARATRIAAGVGQALAIGFVFIGFFINPFLVFIGLFIFLGAQTEVTYTEAQSLLKGHTVDEVTMINPPQLPPAATIRDTARLLLSSQTRDFLVMENDIPVGTLGKKEIIRAIGEGAELKSVSDVMDTDILYLPHTTTIEAAWQTLQRQRKSMAVVLHGNSMLGIIDIEIIAEFIMIREAQQRGHRWEVNSPLSS